MTLGCLEVSVIWHHGSELNFYTTEHPDRDAYKWGHVVGIIYRQTVSMADCWLKTLYTIKKYHRFTTIVVEEETVPSIFTGMFYTVFSQFSCVFNPKRTSEISYSSSCLQEMVNFKLDFRSMLYTEPQEISIKGCCDLHCSWTRWPFEINGTFRQYTRTHTDVRKYFTDLSYLSLITFPHYCCTTGLKFNSNSFYLSTKKKKIYF